MSLDFLTTKLIYCVWNTFLITLVIAPLLFIWTWLSLLSKSLVFCYLWIMLLLFVSVKTTKDNYIFVAKVKLFFKLYILSYVRYKLFVRKNSFFLQIPLDNILYSKRKSIITKTFICLSFRFTKNILCNCWIVAVIIECKILIYTYH